MMAEQTQCPGVNELLVKLQSSEGEVFEVPLEVAKVSRTLSTLLAALGHQPDDLIPLPNVTSIILRRVLGWAEHSVQEGLDSYPHLPPPQAVTTATPSPPTTPTTSTNMPIQPRPQPRIPQRPASRRLLPPPSHTLSAWEKEFLTRNKDNIYDLLLAANYLDIKSLMDVLCRVIADMIKGRDPQDIRRVFHAPNPLGNWTIENDPRSSLISSDPRSSLISSDPRSADDSAEGQGSQDCHSHLT